MTTTPRVVATILLNDCGDLVVPAIESVRDQVDVILCIDTTRTQRNQTFKIARRAAGKKFRWIRLVLPVGDGPDDGYDYGWNGSAADARNFALQQAVEHGDWALTLDTDERIDWNKVNLHETLLHEGNASADVLVVQSSDNAYFKERLYRLPAKGKWVGRVHEGYIDGGERSELPLVTFSEIGKTPEEYRARFERDLVALGQEVIDHPEIGRWWCYLGDTHYNLGQYREAVVAWVRCATCRTWNEEGAWACYRAATTLGEQFGEYPEAADLCGLGLARHATPELAWYMGYLAHKTGRQHDAIRWSHLALDIAQKGGEKRYSFRYPPAWTYKPYEVLHYAHLHLGAIEDAANYLGFMEEAKAKLEG